MTAARRSMVWMAIFALLWVVVEFLATRLGRPYSAYQVVWTRYAVHLGFMLIVWGWRQPPVLWRTPRPVFQIARSMLMLSMPVSVIVALSRGIESDAVLAVFWVAPLLLLIAGRALLGEHGRAAIWLATALATAGAGVSLWRGWRAPLWLMILPLVSALSFSLYVVMTRMLRDEDIRANLFYTGLGVCVALAPLMPFVWVMPSLRDMVILAGVGLSGLAALYALDRAASSAEISSIAPIAAVQVAFTFGSRVVLTHDGLGRHALVAFVSIGTAALWTWMRPRTIAEAQAV